MTSFGGQEPMRAGDWQESKLRKFLTIAVLCVVAAGGIAAAIYMIFFAPTDRADARGRTALHFKCEKCGHEFEMEVRKYSDWAAKNKPAKLGRANCTNCGGELTGVKMEKCPQCHGYFTFEQATKAAAKAGGGAEMVCPHCNYDLKKGMAPRRGR